MTQACCGCGGGTNVTVHTISYSNTDTMNNNGIDAGDKRNDNDDTTTTAENKTWYTRGTTTTMTSTATTDF